MIDSDMYSLCSIKGVVMGLIFDGCGCGGSSSGSSARFCTDMMVIGMEKVPRVSYLAFIYAHKFPVCVRFVVVIVIISNH